MVSMLCNFASAVLARLGRPGGRVRLPAHREPVLRPGVRASPASLARVRPTSRATLKEGLFGQLTGGKPPLELIDQRREVRARGDSAG